MNKIKSILPPLFLIITIIVSGMLVILSNQITKKQSVAPQKTYADFRDNCITIRDCPWNNDGGPGGDHPGTPKIEVPGCASIPYWWMVNREGGGEVIYCEPFFPDACYVKNPPVCNTSCRSNVDCLGHTCSNGFCRNPACSEEPDCVCKSTPTPTPTVTPTATPIPPTPTVTPIATITPSNTPTITPTATPGPSATPIPVPCGTKDCDNATNPCRSGYICVQANDGSNYCTSPDFQTACKANPSYNNCCTAPGAPTATPTEIIVAKTSLTETPKLLQTGTLKSFMYIIPALIMLAGLIL